MRPFIINANHIRGRLKDIVSHNVVPISVRRQLCIISDTDLSKHLYYYELSFNYKREYFYKTDCASFVMSFSEAAYKQDISDAIIDLYIESNDEFSYIVSGFMLKGFLCLFILGNKKIFRSTLNDGKRAVVVVFRGRILRCMISVNVLCVIYPTN